MAEVTFILGIVLTILNIFDRVKGFRRHRDRQADALERIAAALEALERR